MKRILAGAVALAASVGVLSGCGGSSGQCLVTSSGSKVCGADAAAWCRATDDLRNSVLSGGYSSDPTLATTQADCQAFESDYPQ
jgi:hypothetical protein